MLAKQMAAEYLSLGNYIVEHKLYKSIDRWRKSKIVNVVKTRTHMRNIIAKHDSLIVDTHIPEGIVPSRATRMVFVLRCNPQILERRLKQRKWTSEKVRENVMAEILDYCLIAAQSKYGKRKVVQLDTSRTSVKHSVLIARNIISRSKSYTASVDWLAKLEKDRSFAKYLRW